MDLTLLPPYFVPTVLGVLGLIIGSFLDVYASRFHTGVSINGRSHCTSCGHTLSWYELIPFFSYVAQGGRCRSCGARIPVRLLYMELACAALFVSAYFFSHSPLELGFYLVLLSVLLFIAVYDLRHMIIPNEFVIVTTCLSLAYAGYEAYQLGAFMPFFFHILAALTASAFFAGLWLISKGRWIGLGDAKLAFALGLMLTFEGVFSFIVLAFWIGAAVSLLVLAIGHLLRSGKHRLPIFGAPLTMKSEVPFAPFMILSFIAVFLGNVSVLALMMHVI